MLKTHIYYEYKQTEKYSKLERKNTLKEKSNELNGR